MSVLLGRGAAELADRLLVDVVVSFFAELLFADPGRRWSAGGRGERCCG